MKCRHLLLLMSAVLLCSCKAELRDLYYEEDSWNTLQVLFDWQEAPEANPQGMTVLFYDELQSKEPERYDYSGTRGGTASLMFGTYRAIAYNYDTETILYRNMSSWQTLEAYTRYSSIEEGSPDSHPRRDAQGIRHRERARHPGTRPAVGRSRRTCEGD